MLLKDLPSSARHRQDRATCLLPHHTMHRRWCHPSTCPLGGATTMYEYKVVRWREREAALAFLREKELETWGWTGVACYERPAPHGKIPAWAATEGMSESMATQWQGSISMSIAHITIREYGGCPEGPAPHWMKPSGKLAPPLTDSTTQERRPCS